VVTKATGALQTANNFSEIKAAGTAAISEALSNLGVKFFVGNGYITLNIGDFIVACGSGSNTTTVEGNLNIALPITFPNAVIFSNATQANSSYAVDINPLVLSPYALGEGPISRMGFAVRNSKTGQPLQSTQIAARYIAVGF